MSEFAIDLDEDAEQEIDAEMGGDYAVEVEGVTNGSVENGLQSGDESASEEEQSPVRTTYVDHLKSPVVELVVGQGDEQTVVRVHQALLMKSLFFEDACSHFSDVASSRRIELPNENLDAIGCFLEFLYTGEYFPQKLGGLGQRGLARDPSLPEIDATGEQLLKHARVYTLADKFRVPSLKTLAHAKIHCVDSTAKGELAYARYVYATTPKEDDTIRKPVASFWAHRSHVLRSETEDEFRMMCLEFPQFGYDVLTRVLDEKLKNEKLDRPMGVPASSRKRQRHGQL